MSKQSVWQKSWKIIAGLSIILGLITSILQISGAIDLRNLFVFLSASVPLYYVILLLVLLMVVIYIAERIRKRWTSILDLSYGRKIASLCYKPRTTEFLKQQYDYWESQRSGIVIGGYSFDDYLKKMEKEGYLTYSYGKWEVTAKALEYILKYHGELPSVEAKDLGL